MAGRLDNQVLQWCGVDSTQPNDSGQEEGVKCVSTDSGGSYFAATSSTSSAYIYPGSGDYAPRLGGHSQWGSMDGVSSKSPNKEFISQYSMSGGPPHNPHGRQAPPNSAWNHLQVPNFFPARAHMSNELPILATHQATWHTPTTEPSKTLAHSPLLNLQQMISTDRLYQRHSPGVDLSLARNGSQNGDLPQTPISLSVRDANKINSLPPSALDGSDRAVELTKVASPGLQESTPSPKNLKKPNKRVESILERLSVTSASEKSTQSVIVTASSSHDENSNSSQGTGTIPSVPTPTPVREEDVVSPASNEDSLDSNKSRRKRKPSKTIKVSKEGDVAENTEVEVEQPPPPTVTIEPVEPVETSEPVNTVETVETRQEVPASPIPPAPVEPEKPTEPEVPTKPEEPAKSPVRRRSSSEPAGSPSSSSKTRRKTVSESETIDNIAAMVAATEVPPVPIIPEPPKPTEPIDLVEQMQEDIPPKPVPVITRDHCTDSQHSTSTNEAQILGMSEESIEKVDIPETPILITPAQKKGDSQHFVAVEVELEKMFAGIADTEPDTPQTDPLASEPSTSQIQNSVESVTSTSEMSSKNAQKRGRPQRAPQKGSSRRPSESNSTESTPRKKHKANKKHDHDDSPNKKQIQSKNKKGKKLPKSIKPDVVKDVYSYDSGSNASSSRSKGPFIQIRGPRDSPISVSIVNAPSNEDDPEKAGKQVKNKKFHDDSEYRHKVRSKGLHCSTLSNKYDAQTRDATWICVFCKRGPHATDPLLPGPSPFTLDLPQYSPGDLFGPYIISTDCPEYQRRVDDPFDTLFKSKKLAMLSPSVSDPKLKKSKKRLNSESNRDSIDSTDLNKDVMLGIAEISSNSYEVWVHEDCVIWGPGVYLVGPKIVGLEGAVWSACSILCKRCGLRGAAVSCLKRGCDSVMHVGCAKLSNWKLDEDNYKAYCKEHSMP